MKISRDTSCCGLSLLTRPVHQFLIRRVAGYEANRNFIDREWYDEAPCLCMRTHVCSSGLPLFLHRKIGEDQLADYAARRGMSIEETKKFLAANL